jgi:hypothetical protein
MDKVLCTPRELLGKTLKNLFVGYSGNKVVKQMQARITGKCGGTG